jgi:hypothetical protein
MPSNLIGGFRFLSVMLGALRFWRAQWIVLDGFGLDCADPSASCAFRLSTGART